MPVLTCQRRGWPALVAAAMSLVMLIRGSRRGGDQADAHGVGFGDDMNGFASQGAPREGAPNPVRYPFKSFDGGVRLQRQQTGERVFDINTDGVAHFGMYPDWVEDLRKQAGNRIVKDLANGAEAYLQMWERAVGVPAEACLPKKGKLTARGLGRLRLGDSAKRALRRAGQPRRRTASAYRYCVSGKAGGGRDVRAAFGKRGKLDAIGTGVRGYKAGGVAVGDRASAIPGAEGIRRGVLTRRAGKGARFVYRIRGGIVRSVAVASRR